MWKDKYSWISIGWIDGHHQRTRHDLPDVQPGAGMVLYQWAYTWCSWDGATRFHPAQPIGDAVQTAVKRCQMKVHGCSAPNCFYCRNWQSPQDYVKIFTPAIWRMNGFICQAIRWCLNDGAMYILYPGARARLGCSLCLVRQPHPSDTCSPSDGQRTNGSQSLTVWVVI